MTDLPAVSFDGFDPTVLADPGQAATGDLIRADVALTTAKKALDATRQPINAELKARGRRVAVEQGVEYKAAVGGVGQAFETFHDERVAVVDAEACADWLKDRHPDVYDAAVVVRDGHRLRDGRDVFNVEDELRRMAAGDTAATSDALVALADRLQGCVEWRVDVLVDADLLDAHFMTADAQLVDDAGEVVPGVSVTPRRYKGLTVRPDSDYAAQLQRRFVRAISGGGAVAEVES